MSNNETLERIQLLLRKAEGTDNQHEAEALRDKAFELAARYDINGALLRARPDAPREKAEMRKGTVQRPFNQLMFLANEVANFSGVKLIMMGREEYYVHGFRDDLDRFQMLLSSLLVQGTRRVNLDYRTRALPGERRSTYKRSWWAAAVSELHGRFDAIKKSAIQNAPLYTKSEVSTEVALRDRSLTIQESVEAFHGKLRRTHMRGSSGSGHEHGREAGRNMDIGGKKLNATRKELT